MERLKHIPLWGTYALLAYMPFHIFVSRWLSLYTGGLGVWDAGKDIVTLGVLVLALGLFVRYKLYEDRVLRVLFIGSLAYMLIHALFLAFDNSYDLRSVVVATLYNGRLLAYLFIAVVAGVLARARFRQETVIKIILVTALITALFGIAQYFLPSDFMTHFGYSIERGVKPVFFIDDKPDFPRVMSTIRDPNSYGAYLILPILLSLTLFFNKQTKLNKKFIGVTVILLTTALLLTFSRSAWLSLLVALAALLGLALKDKLRRDQVVKIAYITVALLAVGLVGGYVMRDSYVVKNVIFHSDEQTLSEDPNELRLRFQQEAAADIVSTPLGHGPGTAGIVAIGNPEGGILTENYYLQIGYEVGITGLAVFASVLIYCYWLLRHNQTKNIFMSVLVATFYGYIVSSLLNHLWSNEAVAAQWWLLAGLMIGLYSVKPRKSES